MNFKLIRSHLTPPQKVKFAKEGLQDHLLDRLWGRVRWVHIILFNKGKERIGCRQ